jgi:DNA-directed RNA polymerase subunit alpha
VDAIFSPVRKVNYNIERTRVGQVTDFERLVLEVWTDGTIKPVEAVREAAENLVNHFFLFSNINRTVEVGVERFSLSVSPETYQTPVDRLDLSPRTLNCLKRAHLTKVGEILEMSDIELLKIRNFGEKSLIELRDKLQERGLTTDPNESSNVGDQGQPVAVLDSSNELQNLSPDDIGELLGGGTITMAAPELTEEDLNWSEEDEEENDQEEDDS